MGNKILITGGTGFIGNALLKSLVLRNFELIAPSREHSKNLLISNGHVFQPRLDTLNKHTNWLELLDGVDVVIHCAAQNDTALQNNNVDAKEYTNINVYGTMNLATQAAACGVKRFIYLSSLKVNGENTVLGEPFNSGSIPMPRSAYAISKFEAETKLVEIARGAKMKYVIIRPPMVYGPGGSGNINRLAQLISKGWPLPFANVKNQRSILALDNLVDLLISCVTHADIENKIIFAKDHNDLTTPELMEKIANAMGKKLRLFPFPNQALKNSAQAFGIKQEADRLLNSLQVDISETRKLLGWAPVITTDEGILRCFKN